MEIDYVIQLRGLNEAAYCRRLYHIMYVQEIFANNADTVTGKMHHEIREGTAKNSKLDGMSVYSMTLYGMEGRLVGKLDGIEHSGDEYIPIEDKNSSLPDEECKGCLWGTELEARAWLNDLPQLIGQMYLLRHNGYECNKGRIYYRGSNKMVEIPYKDCYDRLIERAVEDCCKLITEKQPEPLVDSEKCIRCSLNWVCLPDEVNAVNSNIEEPRRLYPGRPDTSVLYVTSQGGKIGKAGECLTVWTSEQGKTMIPIKDVDTICIFGNVQCTTQAIQWVLKNEVSICYFSYGGWFMGMTSGPVSKNIHMRKEQFLKFSSDTFCTGLIRKIVSAKILNQRTLLRRNRKTDMNEILNAMNNCRKKVLESDVIDQIRGYEGSAAKEYWEGYQQLFSEPDNWKMDGRNRRPPKDEVNALLSYGYALLLRDFVSALTAAGLDYLYGFYHSIVPGRPALALDLMEPYRPLIVDSVVLRIINEGIVSKKFFAKTEAGVFMSQEAKRALIYMYEKRMDEMITHSQFGYRLSYRRMVHLEAKLLGKYLMGDISSYEPLTTR